MNAEEKTLSEGQKLQIIQDNKKLRNKWNKLTREQKLSVLEGMDIGYDYKWLMSLLQDAKEIKCQEIIEGQNL